MLEPWYLLLSLFLLAWSTQIIGGIKGFIQVIPKVTTVAMFGLQVKPVQADSMSEDKMAPEAAHATFKVARHSSGCFIT